MWVAPIAIALGLIVVPTADFTCLLDEREKETEHTTASPVVSTTVELDIDSLDDSHHDWNFDLLLDPGMWVAPIVIPPADFTCLLDEREKDTEHTTASPVDSTTTTVKLDIDSLDDSYGNVKFELSPGESISVPDDISTHITNQFDTFYDTDEKERIDTDIEGATFADNDDDESFHEDYDDCVDDSESLLSTPVNTDFSSESILVPDLSASITTQVDILRSSTQTL